MTSGFGTIRLSLDERVNSINPFLGKTGLVARKITSLSYSEPAVAATALVDIYKMPLSLIHRDLTANEAYLLFPLKRNSDSGI